MTDYILKSIDYIFKSNGDSWFPLLSCFQTSGVISMAQGSRLGWSGPGRLSQCLGCAHWQNR